MFVIIAIPAVLLFLVWTGIIRGTIAQSPRTTSGPGEDRSDMVLIPEGAFDMGTERSRLPSIVQWIKRLYPERNPTEKGFEDETPSHSVEIDSFYLDRYEVTNARYRTFVGATGHREPEGMAIIERNGKFVEHSRFRPWSDSNFNRDQQPVVAVSRDDAQEFCRWAGKRLPTEAEWEKAARGGLNGKEFSWGDDWPPPVGAGNFAEVSFKKVFTEDRFEAFAEYEDGSVFPADVGSFKANGYGIFDMDGNVSEWVEDDYSSDYYRNSPKRNPTGPDAGEKAIARGGTWFYKSAVIIRVAKRENAPPSWRGFDQGFRCAVSNP
jgi:formylglycine-generating enzyme required for sulfatase activity